MPLLSMGAVELAPKVSDAVQVIAFTDKPVQILWITRTGQRIALETVTPPKR